MKNTILGLHAQTAIHAGSGQSLDVIDLPIQREAHSGYPVIFGSSLKGALRAHADHNNAEHLSTIYGSENAEHASAIRISDAKLIALPVRSLTTHFRLVTCPHLLERLNRDLAQIGKKKALAIPSVKNETEIRTADQKDQKDQTNLFLEEYRYTVRTCEKLSHWQQQIADLTGQNSEQLANLSVISNDQFAHICQTATAIAPHIAIDNKNKTVKGGALWFEETLPPETLLYSLISAVDARHKDTTLKATEVLKAFKQPLTESYLQVGGNETVGMGWCNVTFNGGAQ